MLEKTTRGEALLDVVLTSEDKLIKELKIGGSLGSSDHVPGENKPFYDSMLSIHCVEAVLN